MNEAIKIINFMKVVEELCLVTRDNLMSNARRETDSDHILKLAYLVMFVMPYLKQKVDYTKMLELALVHDLVEARAGDVSLSAQVSNPMLVEEKKRNEREAIEHYKKALPEPLNTKVYDLFMEYEAKESRESKIVAMLNKLEGTLQANQYRDGDIRYWAECEGGECYYTLALTKREMIAELDEDIINDLEEAIIEISRANIEKWHIECKAIS